ncbi:MAG: YciI family protein [Agriterribacter sp.]
MELTRLLLITISVFCLNTNGNAQSTYDAALAQKLGADDYGMKKYVMAFLKSGSVQLQDSAKQTELQIAHLKNIGKLAKEGKLVVAGPFMDDQPVRGIYIFNVTTIEEAKKLTETDPAIKAGVLEMELRPWYGSAALMETVNIHKRLEKKSITD